MEKIKILWEEMIHEWKFLSQKAVHYADKKWNPQKWEFTTRWNEWAVWTLVEHTDRQSFFFVEQYRMPVQKRVLELVSGICDMENASKEEIVSAEIREEIWYQSWKINFLLSSPNSAWLTDEIWHLYSSTVSWEYLWQELWESEEIEILEIEKSEVFHFLQEKQNSWVLVSKSIYAALALYLYEQAPLVLEMLLQKNNFDRK